MSHTYAHIGDLKNSLEADAVTWTEDDATLLGWLEAGARRIDGWCDRSKFGSGFGPRTGTNAYDYPDDPTCLYLEDDLLAVTTVTVYDTYGVSAGTLADGTNFLKTPYDRSPFRELTLIVGSSRGFGAAQQGTRIAGTWGYSNETYSVGTGGTVTSSGTSLILSGGTAYAGQTLLVESEQMYVTATGGTATVVRGVNGTTAAVHASGVAVSAYRYDRAVSSANLRLAQRYHKQAQAGLTGDFGAGALPVAGFRDSEASILKSIGHLRRWSAG